MSTLTRVVMFSCLASFAWAADPAVKPPITLTIDEITQNMVLMNARRAQSLQTYEGKRTYRLQYHGFPGSRSAEMVVLVKYAAPGTKEFTIQSTSGSTIVIDKVFKKLLASEKEALETDNQARTALSPANYIFKLLE